MKKLVAFVAVLGFNLLTQASAQAAIQLPGSFSCYSSQSEMSFEGDINEVPGEGIFQLNGNPVQAKWTYRPHCIITRANKEFCSEPNEISISLDVSTASGLLHYNGGLTIYQNSSYAHLYEVDSKLHVSNFSFDCVWKN